MKTKAFEDGLLHNNRLFMFYHEESDTCYVIQDKLNCKSHPSIHKSLE